MRAPPTPAQMLRARAVLVRRQAEGAAVPSPCCGVCAMDETSGLCRGCWRRLEEIAAWSTMADEGKRAVWAAIAQRTKTEEGSCT